jgi:hypothetical protein
MADPFRKMRVTGIRLLEVAAGAVRRPSSPPRTT